MSCDKISAAEPAVAPVTPPTLAPVPPPRNRHRGVWADKLADQTEPQTAWVWDGYLARGEVTLLTSQWKAETTSSESGS